MALTAAEKNRRKRERKKAERAAERAAADDVGSSSNNNDDNNNAADNHPDVEIEYVAEPLLLFPNDVLQNPGDMIVDRVGEGDGEDSEPIIIDEELREVMQRFHDRSSVAYVTEDEGRLAGADGGDSSEDNINNADDDDEGTNNEISKRKLKEKLRPSVALLKQRVSHPELVEAHDVTAPDPDFLVYLKSIPGTVPVPRHWGRKRKYLQGKRGVEKPPFALPDFIIKTGICDVRDATHEDESKMSIKQKNRLRVSGRGGGVDVDYRTLYEAFFQHQTKPERLTDFGDLYYEGKEYENTKSSRFRPGHMSDRLREALGMPNEYSPPPWLINMQRYGPPPSYPNVRIPGLNAPLPAGASYGYHVGGWGKPPVDAYGRPLYGGNPFDVPTELNKYGGNGFDGENEDLYGLSGVALAGGIITSDGKAISKMPWGSLPSAFGNKEQDEDDESEEEESSSEEESSDEEEEERNETDEQDELPLPPPGAAGIVTVRAPGMDSVLPDGVDSVVPTSGIDLRKPGDETPGGPPKQLYSVLRQTAVEGDDKAVFASDHVYVLPGAGPGSGVPDGAASVLSKSVGDGAGTKRTRTRTDEDEADELGKKFKF
jgi:splicing factor 3B subunit 2